MADSLFSLIKEKKLAEIKNIIVNDSLALSRMDNEGILPVSFAAINGYIECLELVNLLNPEGLHIKDPYGRSPIHLAALHGQLESVKFLVANNCSPLEKTADDSTPLHFAVQSGKIDVVRFLLKECKGVDVNLKTRSGQRPIHYAARTGNEEVVEFVLTFDPFFESKGKNSPLAIAEEEEHPATARAIRRYIRSCRMPLKDPGISNHNIGVQVPDNIVKSPPVMERGITGINGLSTPDNPEEVNEVENFSKKLPRIKLIVEDKEEHHGSDQEISILKEQEESTEKKSKYFDTVIPSSELKFRFDPKDYHPKCESSGNNYCSHEIKLGACTENTEIFTTQNTELFDAINKKDYDEILSIIANKPELVFSSDENGLTPLHYAAMKNCLSVAQLLVRHGAIINATDSKGRTALHIAGQNGYNAFFHGLVEMGASPTLYDKKGYSSNQYFIRRRESFTKFIGSCLYGLLEKVENFINENPNFINEFDKAKMTGLMRAVQGNHIEIIKFLISQGSDVNTINALGKSSLFIAIENNNFEVSKLLIENHGDVSIIDGNGDSLVGVSTRLGNINILKLLLNASAPIDNLDSDGFSAIQKSAIDQNYQILELLLENNAQINTIGKNGDTLLHILIRNYGTKNMEIIKELLRKGSNCTIKDAKGQTVLHLSCIKGIQGLIPLIVSKEVDINDRDNMDNTPLFYAMQNGDKIMINFLGSKGAI